MKTIIALFILFSTQISAQFGFCEHHYKYSGPSNYEKFISLPCLEGELYQFDFSTEMVPDMLKIYINDDTLSFYVGNESTNPNLTPFFYRGFCEFLYEDGILYQLSNNTSTIPADFSYIPPVQYYAGSIRIKVRIPAKYCTLKFSLHGNTEINTWLSLCIRKLEYGFVTISDTTYSNICYVRNPEIVIDSCIKSLIIYRDSSIQDNIFIQHASCPNSLNGSITFSKYSDFNQYELPPGLHTIIVNNSVCEREFNIDIEPLSLCDDYYVPNAFSPNGDGENDEFILMTPLNDDYLLSIYDRWGDLVFQKMCISNVSGWDGGDFQNGVYAYTIRCIDKYLTGDVTILNK